MEMMQQALVAAARGWVGVKFHHQGRTREGGVDCLGLLVKVAEECGLAHEGVALCSLDRVDYGRNPDTRGLQDMLARVARQVTAYAAGDVVLLSIEGRAQHLALLADYPHAGELAMIHAYAPAHKVVEHRFDEAWRGRVAAAYRFI